MYRRNKIKLIICSTQCNKWIGIVQNICLKNKLTHKKYYIGIYAYVKNVVTWRKYVDFFAEN